MIVVPQDLCCATVVDDPTEVASAMAAWFDDPDRCAAAAAWLTELADAIGEHGRS